MLASLMAANANGMGMAEQNEIQVEKKIDRVLQLLGMVAVKGLSQTDQIATLSRVGFSPKEIASVLARLPHRSSRARKHPQGRKTEEETGCSPYTGGARC